MLLRQLVFLMTLTMINMALTARAPVWAASEDPIIKKFSNKVVHITIQGPQKFVSYGSGFFISPDGWILTNYHVIEPLLLAPADREITLLLANGKKFSSIRIAKCDISESWLDLCLIKVDHYTDEWFKVESYRPEAGNEVHSIWRDARSLERYSRSSGVVNGYNSQFSWTMLDTSAKIVPGQSGAPIFDKKGRLSAIAVMISSNWNSLARKNQRVVTYQYFGISVDEAVKFLNDSSDFYPIGEYLNAHPIVRVMKNLKQ